MRRISPPALMPVAAALAIAAGFGLAACSSIGIGGSRSAAPAAPGSSRSFTDRMSDTLFGSTAAPATPSNNREEDPDCPAVTVRQGASTITVHGAGEAVATNVRYQGTIAQMARECAFLGATMTMKVGVQGRVVLGPVGGPGRLEVPLRLALVQEGPQPKTVWTKLYKIPVTIPDNQTNVPFVHVEEDLTVPKPSPADLDNYIVYAGFDQEGLKEQKPRSRRQRAR